MVGSRTSRSAEEAQPTGHHARTSHLQSMCDAGPIRSMGPVSLLKVKPAAVTCVLTSQWAIEIARGCAGLNRHVVGEEGSLQERRKRLHPGPESCGGDCEVFRRSVDKGIGGPGY